ncbi:MAG: hypothetical protein K2Q09_02725, partial [Phycisphaerales bacterium]|nr:hypothetical protein [Phycisphaerales bacterium]
MTWSVPLGTVAGITVRLSLIYIVWMVFRLADRQSIGWQYELWSLGSLFVLVLAHEFGHCLACRRVGGEADQILMWMLGGLAYCRPPHSWRDSLITTLGGPAVNMALAPVLMGVMMAFGTPVSALVFNPWGGLGSAFSSAVNAMGPHLPIWLIYGLFTLHVSNAALLLFNVLLPFYPFDGGRIVQELLWRRFGYSRSMWIATTLGLVGAVGLGLFALWGRNMQMFLVAAFGGLTCWQQRQALRFMSQDGIADERWSQWGADGDAWKAGAPGAGRSSARKVRQEEKARKQ